MELKDYLKAMECCSRHAHASIPDAKGDRICYLDCLGWECNREHLSLCRRFNEAIDIELKQDMLVKR